VSAPHTPAQKYEPQSPQDQPGEKNDPDKHAEFQAQLHEIHLGPPPGVLLLKALRMTTDTGFLDFLKTILSARLPMRRGIMETVLTSFLEKG